MNPDLQLLQPYPFQKLARLFGEVTAERRIETDQPAYRRTQTRHAAVHQGCTGHRPRRTGELSHNHRQRRAARAIANWLTQRYGIPAPDAKTQILPVNGSREALFAFAQAVIDRSKSDPVVVCPNPFYQIYEGAAFLAGATPHFLNTLPEDDYALNFAATAGSRRGNARNSSMCAHRATRTDA